MVHNVNCQKRQHMIKPEKIFPLTQDKFMKNKKPIGTKEDYETFKNIAKAAGVKL